MIWVAEATVIKVIDGDTFHARLDIGWGITLAPRLGDRPGPGTVRLVFADGSKYDAPELSTPHGKAAKDVLTELMLSAGQVVTVHSHRLDDFGRTLGSVTLPQGQDLAAVMTQKGFVK